jgi:flavin reductase (DIM6/NTAB) family NADH-FMN oxidoreductase RutF
MPTDPRSAGEDRPSMAALLRDVMAHRAACIAVVTTRGALDADMGMTVSSFSSVSLDPPLAVISVSRTSLFHDALLARGVWAATLLCEEQQPLAACLARPRAQHRPDDFRRWETRRLPGGSLVFPGGLAAVECVTSTTVEAGGSTLVLGLVTATLEGSGRDPLLYFRRSYRRMSADGGAAPSVAA